MLSLCPRASSASALSRSTSTSSPASVLFPFYITCPSARSSGGMNRDEFICQVADFFPSYPLQSMEPPINAIGVLSSGTIPKTLLSCNTPKSGLECVQCVEVFPDTLLSCNIPKSGLEHVQCGKVFLDTMNFCMPDWDAAGREMDVFWEPTDIFSPSKGKWDSEHARKSDLGFVPEHDFEELCWEDGQLLVVMQGLNSKGNIKDQNSWKVNGDKLLSWLQHPPEDLVDKLAIPGDTVSPSKHLVDGEIMLPNDLTHCSIWQNLAFSEDNRPASKNARNDTLMAFPPMTTLNKLGQENHGVIYQRIQANTLAGCGLIPNAYMTGEEPSKSGLMTARLDMPPPRRHSAMVSVPYNSLGARDLSNFSSPAFTFKANLHSLGMANESSGADHLKQQFESTDSTTNHFRLTSHRRGGVEWPVTAISGSVEASNIHNSLFLKRESEQDASAPGAGDKWFGIGIQSDGWNSSLISTSTFGSTEVLEVAELSDRCSSVESKDSDEDGKRGVGVSKRKNANEDLEMQSKALESEATGSKKHVIRCGNTIKKSKATENHNQSERRRRDRISEKMKALQALVPNSYKTDKASMLEAAISYIKALKVQIQIMSFRSGLYFSPTLMPRGMQPVQMASWPHVGMGIRMNVGMGMGMTAGMGMFDMSMAMPATTPRQFPHTLRFPGGVIPAVQAAASAAVDSTCVAHGVAGQVVPLAAPRIVVPARPGVPITSTNNSSPTLTAESPKMFSSQQHQPAQN